MAADRVDIWRALANPHRRRVLDLLRNRPRTTGDLSDKFPDLSRFAVMQHLRVLEEAGLVVVRRRGRERLNYLNAVPLQRAYERWVSRFASEAARRSLELERYLERAPGRGEKGRKAVLDSETVRVVRIENEMRVKASAERAFAAITTEQAEWYPYNYGGERLKSIVFEERVGGQCYEDWGDGRGTLYGTITYYDPPRAYSMRGQLKGGVTLDHWWFLEPDQGGTVVKQSMIAFGSITEEEAEAIRTHGDMKHHEERFRAYVERGDRLGA